jgi:transposase
VFVKIRRRKRAGHVYEYVDIVENHKVQGKVQRTVLGTLGRRDQLPPHKIDALIGHLRKLASPEGLRGVLLGDVRVNASREYGPVLAAWQLWQELGLKEILDRLPRSQGAPTAEAVFRMVANRLVEPRSKLGLVDWEDERGHRHRGWQNQVEWPSQSVELGHQHYLRAMDRLLPHREQIEEQVFARATSLLSLPLRLVFYDVTSTYFEGDGVCQLADYGHSSDHREDRAQVVIGLAVTQEGLPITHRVFPGDSIDVTTLKPMSRELKARFGLQEPVLVGDRGMFSDANLEHLEKNGFRYVVCLRSRQQEEFAQALSGALDQGLHRPQSLDSERTFLEVSLDPGHRHLVVYSALRARHDFEVRDRRLRRALEDLWRLHERAPKERLGERALVTRATRILVESKVAKFFDYETGPGRFNFWLRRDLYRRERQADGFFVLKTNHFELSPEEVVDSYLQLQEVERAFRVLKTLLKLRPIYHWRQSRVEAHIFIVFLAFLLAKVMELRLKAADIDLSIAHALDQLAQLKAVEHTWENQALVVQATRPEPLTGRILAALGIRLSNPVVKVTRAPTA